ncbi:chorismate synthase [Colletotrichum sublineola]|uniref:chorismate synthase n=1 Tax=Colletotrichum sublineola TaxID=1173701 RepID=A0A066X496_COLSU|nr:chorismate synthase [Colletotrichum sublineola]KDN63752.1 putative chorismate synthase [Colletotrichum sublineola]
MDRATVDKFLPVRFPHEESNKKMIDLISKFKERQDSVGGIVTCVIRNPLRSRIPATKGFEIGSGFGGCEIPGSQHNDVFIKAPESELAADVQRMGIRGSKLTTKRNYSGGIQGGISNGVPIYYRVAFKPTATIGQDQTTATYDGSEEGVLAAKGRHNSCVVSGVIPIVEAMARHARHMTKSLLPPIKRENGKA